MTNKKNHAGLADTASPLFALPALFALLALLAAAPLSAADIDRADRLWRDAGGALRDKDAKAAEALAPPGADDGPAVLIINGQPIGVDPRDARQVATALFLAINHRQWNDLRRFLALYRALPDREPYLDLFAQAALASSDGDLERSETLYRRLLDERPDFVRGRIELARVMFENYKNDEAQAEFGRVLADPRLPPAVRANLQDRFLRAISTRRSWSGSISVGAKYDSNLNRTTASQTCLFLDPFGSGECWYQRTVPGPVSGHGMTYEAAASRRFDLAGHHGLLLRGLMYGDINQNQSLYNDATAAAYAGYSWQSAATVLTLAPLFEYGMYGNRKLYRAAGAKADWTRMLTPATSINLAAESKDLRYRADYARNNDGRQTTVSAMAYHGLAADWLLFGGVGWIRKQADDEANAYAQQELRLGVYKTFQAGFSATVYGILGRKRHDAYSALLGARRQDDVRMLLVVLKAPRWRVLGLTPSLDVRRTQVRSNVDWLYSYTRNEISLNLERMF